MRALKKYISLIIALIMIISTLAGCSVGGNEDASSDSSSSPDTTDSKGNDDNDEGGFRSWISRAYEKNLDRMEVPKDRPTSATVSMAKNETEGIQISFTSDTRMNGLSLDTEDSYDGVEMGYYRLHYIQANGSYYPDPIAPFEGKIRFSAGEIRTIYIKFTTTAETKAGTYKYEFKLKDSKGELIQTYVITVHVYEITYPEAPTLDTAFGLEFRSIAFSHGIIDTLDSSYKPTQDELDAGNEIYLKYYEYMLDNKISPMTLPYDILDPRADKYMSDPRLTSFNVPSDVSDDTLAAYYEKLCSNPEWLAKAYIYPVDEPQNKDMLDTMIAEKERYDRICPELRMATSFFVNVNYDSEKDQLQVMGEILDILCAKISNWNKKELGWGLGIADHPTLGSFADRMLAYKEQGKTIWSYVCWEPQQPYANLLLTDEGIDHRIIFWQQYLLGTTGFLYWSVDCYGHCVDPWSTVVSWLGDDIHGDGILIYPGSKINLDEPVGSLRFEACRDGVEDYEIISLAHKLFGANYVKEMIGKVVTDVVTYTESAELFESVRVQMMKDVENALSEASEK